MFDHAQTLGRCCVSQIDLSKPTKLSQEDCEHYQDLTKQLLGIVLHDCEELGLEKIRDANLACPDKKRWKKLQSSPDATIYADRNANSAWLPMMRRQDWKHPVALTVVGQRDCTLDDVLFAVMTPDAVTRRLRTLLMDQRPRKSDQVVPIEVPTQEASFQFLGVTRFLSPHIWPFPSFKSPREMVLAFATGEGKQTHNI
ncbi:unnamed protein product [Peronospora destructor]|uniref:Uncharacterized protein n=1 Tax=Peronospora destructor TaxID=86335 RepID=A0AAV0V485_9STRA|nr:unnamed protein product [Peronospora destructor]